MEKSNLIINKLLVEIFNEVLMIEENALKKGVFNDVTITEVHTIEAIGMYEAKSMSEAAKTLGITVGTLTIAINNLVKKGYVERVRSEEDRRVVKINLTRKGKLLYRSHDKFHNDMVKSTINGLDKKEEELLIHALKNLRTSLKQYI